MVASGSPDAEKCFIGGRAGEKDRPTDGQLGRQEDRRCQCPDLIGESDYSCRGER